MNLYVYTPATDTQEIRSDLRLPVEDWHTEPIRFPWFVPSLPTRHVHRPLIDRVRTSPAAVHLRAATRATFWPAVIASGVILALLAIAYLHQLTPAAGVW